MIQSEVSRHLAGTHQGSVLSMSILFRSSVFSTVIFSKKDKNSAKETLHFTLQSQKVQSVTSCSMFSFDLISKLSVNTTTKKFSKKGVVWNALMLDAGQLVWLVQRVQLLLFVKAHIHVDPCYQSTFSATILGWDDINLFNFWHNVEKTPEDVNEIAIVRTDTWIEIY